ncbi:GNAT family N-acetyltransferase [Egicoccus halophilus]|uniref:GNAT family N-acetyltransferase n=1 Tax=Egicoccus halophilus TaxID=1670830 RepID=A0A8J3AAB2_9ACTN|nr:N-acetylglutaminylglutamine synthetase [Egicoccus halophilus]GGI08430.1 GNAT family N-acetyltransferase [Egicoccus halophilus]
MNPTHERGVRAARGHVRDASKPNHGAGLSTRSWDVRPPHLTADLEAEVTLECGWGRLIFGQTFASHEALVRTVADEEPGRRDICLYVREPHVLVAHAPQELFIDPSHTYRKWLHQHRAARDPVRGVVVRDLRSERDADAVNRIYTAAGMVVAPAEVLWANQRTSTFTYLVAEDADTGEIIGTVTGVDHRVAFNDPEDGTSLWCLAVDPQSPRPGVGRALVSTLLDRFKARGRAYLDLSVVHDNEPAIGLYEKLGFVRVPVFCVKRKNPINERLFSAAPAERLDDLNPYARLLADEALRRGISVEVLDAESGLMQLTHGGRSVQTRESLSELTSAVAMSKCDDKRLTNRLFVEAGLRVPRGAVATDGPQDEVLLEELGQLVVKPARGEQGQGITVGVHTVEELREAIRLARTYCPNVLLEECVTGRDLRIVVIGHQVVAAAIRRPATVVGTGRHTVRELIESTSRRRAAATSGESEIPLDAVTEKACADNGFAFDDVLPKGEELEVRRTANLHTGGTIHDVTEKLHPTLADAAVRASRKLDIPVVGLDMLVPDVSGEQYVFIEANERPGLANHEPQPTAQKFIDLLFPATRPLPRGWEPAGPSTDHRAADEEE